MSSSPFGDRVHRLGPGVAAGMSLGISDVLGKIVLTGGVDVVSMLLFRSVVGLLFFATWFRVGDKPTATPAVRIVSLTVGIIFAGLIFCLFKAIETIDVPTAVLSYFTYPILTGLTAAVAGIERLRWKGMVCAVAAFQQPGLADRRASCRFHYHRRGLRGRSRVLAHRCSIDNARLSRRRRCPADYLVLHAVVHSDIYRNRIHRQTWNMPHSALNWIWLVTLSFATTAAILCIFLSTVRIGAFRTAVITHLEPLSATVLSTVVLREVITPVQATGGHHHAGCFDCIPGLEVAYRPRSRSSRAFELFR